MASVKDRIAALSEAQPRSPPKDQPFPSLSRGGASSPTQIKLPKSPQSKQVNTTIESPKSLPSTSAPSQVPVASPRATEKPPPPKETSKTSTSRPTVAGSASQAKAAPAPTTRTNGTTTAHPAVKKTTSTSGPRQSLAHSSSVPRAAPTTTTTSHKAVASTSSTGAKRQSLALAPSTTITKKDPAKSAVSPQTKTTVPAMPAKPRQSNTTSRTVAGPSGTATASARRPAPPTTAAPRPPATLSKAAAGPSTPTATMHSRGPSHSTPSSGVRKVGGVPVVGPIAHKPTPAEMNKGHATQVHGLEKELHEWKAKCIAREEDIRRLRSEIETVAQRHAAELQQATRDREALTSNHASELEQASAGLENAKTEHSTAVRQIQDTHSTALDQLRQEHADELAKLRDTSSSEVESLKRQHSEELSSVRSGHRTEYDELVEKHSQELRELKDGHTQNHADLTSSHSSEIEELNRQIQSITNQLNDEISEAKADHESKMRDAKEQHDSTLNEKETAHAAAIENLTNELAAQKMSYEASITNHTSTKGELTAAENIITELRAKVDDLQQEIVTTKESASTAVATKNDEMVKLTAELVDTREQLGHAQEKLMKFDEMEKLNSETHLRENKERENEIFAKNNEIADLRAKLTDIESHKDEQFAKEHLKMVEDHQSVIALFEERKEKERQILVSEHKTQVDEYSAQIASITVERTNAEIALKDLAADHQKALETLTSEKDALITAAELRLSERERELQTEIAALTDAVAKAQSKMIEMLETLDANDQKYKSDLAVRPRRPKSPKSVREFINERIGVQARDEAHNTAITKLEEEKQKDKDAAIQELTTKLTQEREAELQTSQDAHKSEKEALTTQIEMLQTSLTAAQTEADKVKGLQNDLEELKVSSASAKTTAIENLTAELQQKHQKEMDTLKDAHESELSSLKQSHEKYISDLTSEKEAEIKRLSELSIREELRNIKANYEHDIEEKLAEADRRHTQDLVQATSDTAAHTRAIMNDEIRSLETTHTAQISSLHSTHQQEMADLKAELTAEKVKAVDEAVAKIKSEYTAQTEAITKKVSSDMKSLSDAHSAKTASLESEIAEMRAAKLAAEERARKNPQEELSEAKSGLEEAKKKLQGLKATDRAKLADEDVSSDVD